MNPADTSSPARSRRQRILLLDSEDRYPPPGWESGCDLIVDFGHAAPETHRQWAQQAGCRVVNLFEFCRDLEDLYRTRDLLQQGTGQLVDRYGIDWWDVLSVMITPGILNLLMIHRLASSLDFECDLYMSRPMPGARALAKMMGMPLHSVDTFSRGFMRRLSRYRRVASEFDSNLALQIALDKFDGRHVLRSRLARRRQSYRQPVVLLPTAYANVSRAALHHARQSPEQNFLLVHARRIARVASLPPNVESCSLDSYFSAPDQTEIAAILENWQTLKRRMISRYPEFAAAEAAGILERIPALVPWGIAVRDAWLRLFDTQEVAACLTADDGNPYTRLPLILARMRGIPALACHHGALDYAMAVKTNYSDLYLAKTEMEADYLLNVCRMPGERIAMLDAARHERDIPTGNRSRADRSWLVFFTENSIPPWRGEEAYRDLMPALLSLSRTLGLKLIFKLHPFECRGDYQRWVREFLPVEDRARIAIMTGPPPAELWRNTRVALTVQSSTALECHAQGIPVFLCRWLREPNCAYQDQYARFGIAQVLETPAQIEDIPRALQRWNPPLPPDWRGAREITRVTLSELLSSSHSLSRGGRAQCVGD